MEEEERIRVKQRREKDKRIKQRQAAKRKERAAKLALGIDDRRSVSAAAKCEAVVATVDVARRERVQRKRAQRRRAARQRHSAKVARDRSELRTMEKNDPKRQLIDDLDRRRRLQWRTLRELSQRDGRYRFVSIDGPWQRFALPYRGRDKSGVRAMLDPERLELRSHHPHPPRAEEPPIPVHAECFFYCAALEHFQWGNPEVVAETTNGVEPSLTDRLLAKWRVRFHADVEEQRKSRLEAAADGAAFTRRPMTKKNETTILQRMRDVSVSNHHDHETLSPMFHGPYYDAHVAARGYDCSVCGNRYTPGCPACGNANDASRVIISDAVMRHRALGTSRRMLIHVRAVPQVAGVMAVKPRAMWRYLTGLDEDCASPQKEYTTVACTSDMTLADLYSLVEMNIAPQLVEDRLSLFLPSMIGTIHLDPTVQRETRTRTAMSPGLFTLAEMNLRAPESAGDAPVHIVLLLSPMRHAYATVECTVQRFLEQNIGGGLEKHAGRVSWNAERLPDMARHRFSRDDRLQRELLKLLRINPLRELMN